MIKMIFYFIIIPHLIGNYLAQSDFIATTKGLNWHHLFVRCVLYCVPFYLWFGVGRRLAFIFISHMIIELLKTRYNKITYWQGQGLYYAFELISIYLF